MATMLAENIRKCRKARGLTQEQLSEVLGVTAGAVYKWEAKLSTPDLDLIVRMADFFDTSVDVLLGYEMKDNRLEAALRRLQDFVRRKDAAGIAEAEKAIKKYPNSFPIIHESAALFGRFGVERGDEALTRQSLELLKRSLLLLDQNTDPQISEQTLIGEMATAYMGLGETDKAIDILKAHNAGGMYNPRIGYFLVSHDRPEEAEPYLSKALVKVVSDLIFILLGFVNVFMARGDAASTRAILEWGIDSLLGLRKDDKPNYLDKVVCALYAIQGFAQYRSGDEADAEISLRRARELADFFDAAPSYDMSDLRFISPVKDASVYDDIGATAAQALEGVVASCEDEAFTAFWHSISNQEENDD